MSYVVEEPLVKTREPVVMNCTPFVRQYQMLSALLSSTLSPAQKIDILSSQYQFPISHQRKELLDDMCNLSKSIEDKGIEKGIEKGRVEGRINAICEFVYGGILSLQDGIKKLGFLRSHSYGK